MRNGSALLLGPGGSGKTHMMAAFLEEIHPPYVKVRLVPKSQ